jgi:hypothetical protein
MNTNAMTAQNCSLFEIDVALEAAFDHQKQAPNLATAQFCLSGKKS